MKRIRKPALAALAIFAVAMAGYAGYSRLASPESAARTDSYWVWIALLKGFDGDVYYVGNDSANAYFRIGRLFWSYYKLPAYAVRAPESFQVGAGEPYVVRLHVQSDNSINVSKPCSQEQGYELGQLDRA